VQELLILRKLLSSRLFWFYIKNTSKPYGLSFFSLSSNYLKDFGICELTPEEKTYILQETDKDTLDRFFEEKYNVACGLPDD
jgi:adenine-specific DNA-methyltransferase